MVPRFWAWDVLSSEGRAEVLTWASLGVGLGRPNMSLGFGLGAARQRVCGHLPILHHPIRAVWLETRLEAVVTSQDFLTAAELHHQVRGCSRDGVWS